MSNLNLVNLDPTEILALHKIELPKALRRQIEPGTYDVDLVVRVTGTVGVGQDYVQRVSPSVPWRGLLLAALSQMTPAHRRMFVRDYLAHSDAGAPATVNADAIEAEVLELAEAIIGTAEKVCSGKTRATLAVEALSEAVVVRPGRDMRPAQQNRPRITPYSRTKNHRYPRKQPKDDLGSRSLSPRADNDS